MQTFISEPFSSTTEGREANRILRSCVHCGFCTAICPTYRLLGDELDSPRGRIYLIKNLLEGETSTAVTQLHLDRCLTCRACETGCPSGVEYGRLLDIGRQQIEKKIKRPLTERVFRYLLRLILPYRWRFTFLLRLGQVIRPVLPAGFKKMIPSRAVPRKILTGNHTRKVILFSGCVQPAISPGINEATQRVLDRLSINTISIKNEGCCGAISFHMGEIEQAKQFIKSNIDCWWPKLEGNTESIVITASGCGAMIKEYGYIMRNDPVYAEKAEKISTSACDIVEIFDEEMVSKIKPVLASDNKKLAFHNPCTLQHGQTLPDKTENLLSSLGFRLAFVPNHHICCGSAGVYSLLQQKLSTELQKNKINDLLSDTPDHIATANIGCLLHLQQATDVPVKHWIELLDNACRTV